MISRRFNAYSDTSTEQKDYPVNQMVAAKDEHIKDLRRSLFGIDGAG